MKPSTSARKRGSVISSRTAATDLTKNFSPSGNVPDNTPSTWLMTMSPPAAKCFGRSATYRSNCIGRMGTCGEPPAIFWALSWMSLVMVITPSAVDSRRLIPALTARTLIETEHLVYFASVGRGPAVGDGDLGDEPHTAA